MGAGINCSASAWKVTANFDFPSVIPYWKPFKCDFSYSFVAVDKISTDVARREIAELLVNWLVRVQRRFQHNLGYIMPIR